MCTVQYMQSYQADRTNSTCTSTLYTPIHWTGLSQKNMFYSESPLVRPPLLLQKSDLSIRVASRQG